MKAWRFVIGAATCAAALAAGAGTAHAGTPGGHYYIEIGGTGAAAPAPACSVNYVQVNRHLAGGTAVPVCYPASGGPFEDGHNNKPAPTAMTFDRSVAQGYRNALRTVEATYRRHPRGRFTIVGYSQGAEIGDLLLQTLARGTVVPRSQVDGLLYADPMQPGTGIWSKVPRGLGVYGWTSTGPGPATFRGIPVERFCIHTDGVCDATSIQSINGFIVNHPRYITDGIVARTITHDGRSGTTWYS